MSLMLGQDLPLGRPDADSSRSALFVPSQSIKEELLLTIRKGAAVVGFGNHDRTLTIYFESNRFNDPALASWAQKARKAYDRLAENLPTVSKMVCDPENFEQVGYINGKSINVRRMPSLLRWLEYSDALDSAPAEEVVLWTPPPPPKKIG